MRSNEVPGGADLLSCAHVGRNLRRFERQLEQGQDLGEADADHASD